MAGALGATSAFLSALAGEYGRALPQALGGGGVVLLATWAWGYPARQWLAFAVMAGGMATSGQPVVAVAFLAVIGAVSLVSGLLLRPTPSKSEFTPLGLDVAIPKAEPAFADFETAGFRRVGGYSNPVPLGRRPFIAGVMIGPGLDRFAVVTDKVLEVVSRFGERWLITISSALSPLPEDILRQHVPHGRPAELVAAHEAGVELLSRRGLRPDRFPDDEAAVDAARALELRAVHFISASPLKNMLLADTRGKGEDPVLRDNDGGRRRVESWLAAPVSP